MNETGEHPLTIKAKATFHQAARNVVRLAKQTGAPVIVWENGQIREIPCDSAELTAWMDEPDEPSNPTS